MKRETAVRLWKGAKRLGYHYKEQVKIDKKYSGRGYCRETYALIVPNMTYVVAMAAAGSSRRSWQDFADELEKLRYDNLGNDIVVY